MKARNVVIWVFLIGSIIMAPIVQKIFHFILLEPAAYYWWRIKLVFQVIPQMVYWYFGISCLGGVVAFYIMRDLLDNRKSRGKKIQNKGQVEALSEYIKKSEKRNYFKWLIANRLAILTSGILNQRRGDPDQQHSDFSGLDQKTTPKIRTYLEAGYRGSFLEYRNRYKWLPKSRKTPFDLDLSSVIEFIESQME